MTEAVKSYIESFGVADHEPEWLAEQRRLAIERLSVLGFPTTKHEDYKYTNLSPLSKAPFAWPQDFGPDFPDEPDLTRVNYGTEEESRHIFMNGRAHSAWFPDDDPVTTIGGALHYSPDELAGHLTRYADIENHALTAFNTAFFYDGAFIRIPEKKVIEDPIHIIFISAGEPGTISHPRTMIYAGRESQASVIESYISLTDGAYWTNAVTEIVAEEGARIDHFKAQQESLEAYHTGMIDMLAERNAYISTISLSFGGKLTRNDVNIKLEGEGAECALDGLFVVGGKQHVDHHTTIDHAAPHCNSHQLYKGVLDGESGGVFNGKIIVRKDAQKTDAIQNNNNLLLSRKAEIDTKPQLQIDANDVRCTHGATIGQLSKEALFYVRARGIAETQARSLLTYAFAADVLERVSIEPLKEYFEQELLERFAGEVLA